jgi:hypothetical protein
MFFFQVLFACVAAASAQLVDYGNGLIAPAKTPEVQAAEAAHFAAIGNQAYGYAAQPWAYNGYAHGAYAGAYAYAGYPYNYNYGAYPYATGYAGYFGGLVAHPNGAIVPVDEPAVQQARAEHFAAKGLAVAPIGYATGYAYHGLVAHPNGALVPAEPADVVAARAEHLSHF